MGNDHRQGKVIQTMLSKKYTFGIFVTLFMLTLLIAPTIGTTNGQAQITPQFRVYMTFEDGPTRAYTPQLLDTLAQYNARATFFPNGYQIAGNEDILQRMIRDGHAIGNHLWEEPGYYSGAPEDMVREAYLRSEQAIREALTPDLQAIYDAQTKLFRQPGGGANPFPASDDLQVISYNWHVDSDDCGWRIDFDNDPMSFDERVLHNVLREYNNDTLRYNVYAYGDGALIVFHDINRVTGRVLPVIMSELQSAGATFEALPRPWDTAGTMPVALGTPPQYGEGIQGVSLSGHLNDYAWIRTEPTPNAPLLIESLPPNTPLTVTGRTSDWYQVQYNGQTGWVYMSNLTVLGPIPSLPRIN